MSTRPAKSPARPVRREAHEVRIVGGLWKRTRLPVLDLPGLRPTPDRVRETLFNWLGQDLGGWHCVDAFAGTGVLGFEAASRGAAQVLLVEQAPALVRQLELIRAKLDASATQIQRGDAISTLARLTPSSQDLVLIDPPFDAQLFEKATAPGARALKAGGWLYLEAPQAFDAPWFETHGLELHRHLKAGAVHAHLARRTA